jgi:hypothetical protein
LVEKNKELLEKKQPRVKENGTTVFDENYRKITQETDNLIREMYIANDKMPVFVKFLENLFKMTILAFSRTSMGLYHIFDVDVLDNQIYYINSWLMSQGVKQECVRQVLDDIIEGIIQGKGSKYFRGLVDKYKNKTCNQQPKVELPETILPE